MANSPQIIEPEVMPKAETLPTAWGAEARVQRVFGFHKQAEAALQTWAEAVVLAGMELHRLKAECKANGANWMAVCDFHFSSFISHRHITRYMQVADGFMKRLGKNVEPAELTESQQTKLRKRISAETSATTWRQLMMDFGIGHVERNPRGGSQTSEASDKDASMQARADAANETLTHLVTQLRLFVIEEKTHNLCDPAARESARTALQDVCKALV